MFLNIEIAHKLVFYILFLFLFAATTVFIERLLYFFFTFPTEKKLIKKEVEKQDEITAEVLYHSYAEKTERGKGVLMFVITASPLMGLLGTVLGIMNSFLTMAERGVSDIAAVSKGIAFALEATALGIVVSVISLFYYYAVNGLSKKAKEELKKAVLETIKLKGED
ncbi:biopolymer transport protein ExbB [Thermovibrio guaymasensis]|uniref:Biopolymer transport protein ExbB n=1 Tax=Thermovibrio guaymasensis TaxID=240167 RepID=A0A420W9M7_9BACT|nr:MotA/TolQ/ExbB proton channel family protein [Thermovibrio guaymasensis]RKQ64007.1 biopolymer transport protein ExbB [Thermovibrio guaymasensis]